MNRCSWCLGNDLYVAYHDTEWGVPCFDDHTQFEFLVLESAQAGLSWITLLKKRENYRLAYDGFDPEIVAGYTDTKVNELLENAGIIRNRRKIESSINNARLFLDIQAKHGSFSNYIWDFVDGKPVQNNFASMSELPAKTELSEKISKDLKQKGFKFLGPTIIYSHLQALGIVNDHVTDCYRYSQIIADYDSP